MRSGKERSGGDGLGGRPGVSEGLEVGPAVRPARTPGGGGADPHRGTGYAGSHHPALGISTRPFILKLLAGNWGQEGQDVGGGRKQVASGGEGDRVRGGSRN